MKVALIILGCIVLFVLFKFLQSATPKGFAKQLAKVQLHALRRQKKDRDPGLSFRPGFPHSPVLVEEPPDPCPQYMREEQWVRAIMTRPRYSENIVRDIIDRARANHAKDRGLNFQMVVIELAKYEYRARMGHDPRPADISKLVDGVLKVLPDSKWVEYL